MTTSVIEAEDPFRVSRTPRTFAYITLFVVVLLAAAMLVRVPYVVMKPGPTTNILGAISGPGEDKPVLSISGATTYPTSGELMFTTVLVEGGPGQHVSAMDLFVAWLTPSQVVLPEEQVYPPGQTQEQAEEEGAAEMASSQEVAATVALRELGQKVPEKVSVAEVPQDSPNAAILRAGDSFVAVDGVPLTSADQLRSAISATKAGATLPLTIRRKGVEQTVEARTVDSGGRAVIGVYLSLDYDLPFTVEINAGGVGGPSAGLMVTLAIEDALTPGAATGGKAIAGTGTMSADGSVGPIGGIQQKMVGAQNDGAEWFLAPAENCSEVVGHVPDGMRVVRVATFAEGWAAVKAISQGTAANLPTCA